MALAALIFVFNQCMDHKGKKTANLRFVGSESCMPCHQREFSLYATSDHSKAMDTASASSVLGNFNNSRFVYFGDTSYFYEKDGKYFVRTVDTTGARKEFQVSYTFGWKPLQQYLVKFNDGRVQVLPFCWDTRPKEKGGQHWFHIYDKEKIPPQDELFWMSYNQNWNYMCADCHTTDFKKNFDFAANSFHSSWQENKVSCESCHGPASGHLEWAKDSTQDELYKGFPISLASKKMVWKMDQQKGTTIPQQVIYNDTLITVCSRCHARALRFTDVYTYGESFFQSHNPTPVNSTNYYIDGQIKDEDYEYGSFLQSKMYTMGVTCINCHDPHSMQIRLEGNNLCFSCHSPEKFNGPQHSHHPLTSEGNQCANCHMPVTTYMVVDNRRDHSIRIPRPDQSLFTDAPNACNKCHTDKPVQWASDNFLKWYGSNLPAGPNYAALLYKVSEYITESEPSLYTLLSSKQYPAIIKAGAMEQYAQLYTPRLLNLAKANLGSDDPLLRVNAVKSLNGLPAEIVLPSVSPLLGDKVMAVRLEATFTLAAYYPQLDAATKAVFEKGYNEYIQVQRGLSHNPEGYLNQGIIMGLTGRTNEAEQMYLQGIKRFPAFIPFYMNLADTYRSLKNETKAKEYLGKGLAISPANADLHYAMGLWLFRNKENDKGMEELKKATQLNPSNPSAVYGYAVALYSVHQADKAIALMEDFLKKNGNNPQVLDGLISINHDIKRSDREGYYADLRKKVFGY